MKKPNLINTKKALIEYDINVDKLFIKLDKAKTSKQVTNIIKEWDNLVNILREAFVQDTKHINTMSQVGVMSADDIRQICKKY